MIFIVGIIIVFFSGIVCVNCGDYEEMPITRYKQWLRDRNWFGKYMFPLQLYLVYQGQ